jgi:hypothetical protein
MDIALERIKPHCTCQEFNSSHPLLNPSLYLTTNNKIQVLTLVQIFDDTFFVKVKFVKKHAIAFLIVIDYTNNCLSTIYELTNQTIPGRNNFPGHPRSHHESYSGRKIGGHKDGHISCDRSKTRGVAW